MTLWKNKNYTGLIFLMIGGMFLFNPIIALKDYLPDVCGYFLIWLGLWRLSELNDQFEEASHYARAMILTSLGELAMWWFCYGFLPSITQEMVPDEIPMAILLGSFAWAILNWCFLIPLLRNLFGGFAEMAIGCGACSITEERRSVPRWRRVYKKGVRMAILLPVLSFLPELTILSTINMRSPTPTVSFDWYRFIELFRGAAAVLAGLIGLVWLISYLRFFTAMLRDTAYTDHLKARYDREVLPMHNRRLYRRLSLAFMLLTVALIFSADLRFDHRSVLPTYVLALLACIAYTVISYRSVKACLPLYLSGGVLIASSVAYELALNSYLAEHLPEDALHLPRAYEAYASVRILECIESALTLLFLGVLIFMLARMFAGISATDQNGLFKKEGYRKTLVLAALFAVGTTAVDVYSAFLREEIKFLWLIGVVLSLIMLLIIRSCMNTLRDEVLSRAQAERMHKREEREAY